MLQGTPPGVARHASRLHRARSQVSRGCEASTCVARVCRAVKLRGNSTGHASMLHRRAQVSPPRCSESIKVLSSLVASCRRVSKVPTITGMRGVVVAKRRTVVDFGLVSCRRVSKAKLPAQPSLAPHTHTRDTRERLRTLRGRFADALTTIAGQRLDRPSDVVHSHDYSFGRMICLSFY